MKRLFDVIFGLIGFLVALPFLVVIAIAIKLDSKGPVFYMQNRVGLRGKDFKIIKFRTMRTGADKISLLSFGDSDPRVTKVGRILRKYRLDELPQFINILKNDMSFVGPRPEVRKYVDYYNEEQIKILAYKPGVTDMSCITFIDKEDKILNENLGNFDKVYIEEIMGKKIDVNLKYFIHANFASDFKILLITIKKVFKKDRN